MTSSLVHRIEDFTRNQRGVVNWSASEAWSAWRVSTELKSELLEALSERPQDDSALLLSRQRLCSGREALKRRLLALLNPAAEASIMKPDFGRSTSGRFRAILGKIATRSSANADDSSPDNDVSEARAAEDSQEARQGFLTALQDLAQRLREFEEDRNNSDELKPRWLPYLEEAFFLRTASPDTDDDKPGDSSCRLVSVRLANSWADAVSGIGERGDESVMPLIEIWEDELVDRLEMIDEPLLVWSLMREGMVANKIVQLIEEKFVSPLATVHARLDWLEREAETPKNALMVFEVRLDLIVRRLRAYLKGAEGHLDRLEKGAADDEAGANLSTIWNWLQTGTSLAARAQEMIENSVSVAASEESMNALRELVSRQNETMERMRTTLCNRVDQVSDSELENWRSRLVVRADDILSQVPSRAPAWSCGALRDARFDIKWLEEEYERRIGGDEENGDEDEKESAPSNAEEAVCGESESAESDARQASPTSLDRSGLKVLKRMRADVRNEHREWILQSRMERLLTRSGAHALDILINLLIVFVLVLLGIQLFQTIRGIHDFNRHLIHLTEAEAAMRSAEDYREWTEYEIHQDFSHQMEKLDAMICVIFLFEFFLKLLLAESSWWYFRKHWFTDFLPSIPFGYLLRYAAANYIMAVRSIRLIRVVRAFRFVRLFSLLQRITDRLIRKFRPLLDIRIVAFDEGGDLATSGAVNRDPMEDRFEVRTGRFIDQALSRTRRLLDERGRRTGFFWSRQLDLIASEVQVLPDDSLVTARDFAVERGREIRLEELISRLKETDVLQIEAMLGSSSVRQIGQYFNILSPILKPTLGISQPLRALPPGEKIKVVAIATAERLEAVFERGVNFVRDLYGIVSVAEFLSFVGGFFTKVFKRQRNRLFIGLGIVLIGLAMIEVGDNYDMFVVTTSIGLPAETESRTIDDYMSRIRREVRRHDGTCQFAPLVEGEEITTMTVAIYVPQHLHGRADQAKDELREAIENRLELLVGETDVVSEVAALERIGKALKNSFGVVLLLVGSVGFLFVWFGNWLMNRAGQVVDEHMRVAEAQFINLMKDYKRRNISRDLKMIADRVLQPDFTVEDVISGKTGDRLVGRMRDHLEHATGLADKAARGFEDSEPLDLLIDRILFLYRDALDGALLHRSDIKTTEQLLGNIAIQEIVERVGLTKKQKARLEKLDLAKSRSLFGPYIWFAFITNSICQKVGRMVLEFNRRHGTNEFTSLHFITRDAAREAALERTHGKEVVDEIRAARRDLIRSIFGSYPMTRRSVNVFSWYRQHYEGGIRIFKLPFHFMAGVVYLLYRGVLRFIRLVRDFVDPENALPPPSPYAGPEVAFRKINRMRRPAYMAALELRARIDLAYLDISIPGGVLAGCEGDTYREDLDLIGATPRERRRILELRENAAESVREFARRLESLGLIEGDERDDSLKLRAWFTEYAINPDIAMLIRARRIGGKGLRSILDSRGRPAERKLSRTVRWVFHRVGQLFQKPSQRRSSNIARFIEAVLPEDAPRRDRVALERAYYFDVNDIRGPIDCCVKHDAIERPLEKAVAILRRASDRAGALNAQLSTMRTLQTLSVIDLINYRNIIVELGEFDLDREAITL